MSRHNLGTVIAFEIRRTLLKPVFWVSLLSIPALVALLLGLMFWSGTSTVQRAESTIGETLTFTYSDASGVVLPEVAARLGGSPAPDAAAAAEAVRQGRAELHIEVPADPTSQPVHVVARDIGLIDSAVWSGVGSRLVRQSAQARIGDARLASLATGVQTTQELWSDGVRSPGWGGVIAPGAFLALLYLALVMFGPQMLNITLEEKENRVTEMILTTIHPSTLILGKVVALLVLGVVQGAMFTIPLLVWALFTAPTQGASAALPTTVGLDDPASSMVVIDPVRIALGAGLFLSGFLLIMGLLVAIGAVVPTAKDGSTAFGAVLLGAFVPAYMMFSLVSAEQTPVTVFLTWFPLTSPAAALLRNAAGTLPPWQAGLVTLLLFVTAVGMIRLGIRLFRQGSVAYDLRFDPVRAVRHLSGRSGRKG